MRASPSHTISLPLSRMSRKDRDYSAASETEDERCRLSGGEGGIRTHVTQVMRPSDFESAPLWPLRYLSQSSSTMNRALFYRIVRAPRGRGRAPGQARGHDRSGCRRRDKTNTTRYRAARLGPIMSRASKLSLADCLRIRVLFYRRCSSIPTFKSAHAPGHEGGPMFFNVMPRRIPPSAYSPPHCSWGCNHHAIRN